MYLSLVSRNCAHGWLKHCRAPCAMRVALLTPGSSARACHSQPTIFFCVACWVAYWACGHICFCCSGSFEQLADPRAAVSLRNEFLPDGLLVSSIRSPLAHCVQCRSVASPASSTVMAGVAQVVHAIGRGVRFWLLSNVRRRRNNFFSWRLLSNQEAQTLLIKVVFSELEILCVVRKGRKHAGDFRYIEW